MNDKKKPAKDFVPIREVCRMVGLKYCAIRKFVKEANIKSLNMPSGQTLYSRQSILDYIGNNSNTEVENQKPPRHKIVYCRVSSEKQKDDLQRQVGLAESSFPGYEIISDIGSGINWKRKGIQTILGYAMQRNLEELIIFHKDRLTRFGFDLFKSIIELSGGKIKVLHCETEESSEVELSKDLLAIIHIFNCREMGKRRYSKRGIKNNKDETPPNAPTEITTTSMA
jgi:predicted site-specific integrase-resolvase